MNHPSLDPLCPSVDLDGFVAAFEAARSADAGVDLSAFLPDRDDPLVDPVLCELIRVDLEFGWEQRRPRPLADYQRRFPDFFLTPDHVAAVAYEEYRLRRQAGQCPSAAEYAATFGVDVSGWSKSPLVAPGSA